MNLIERQEAYREIVEWLHLRAAQRDQLDACPELTEILQAAHDDRWATVEQKLFDNNII